MKTNEKQRTTPSQMTKAIERGYAGLDPVRGNAIDGLLAIREAKIRQTQRELEQEEEAKNKDAANALKAKLETNRSFVSVLKREATHARTKSPAPEADAAIVHGYVWVADGSEIHPAENISMTLAEMKECASGKKLAQGKTDKRGYFELRIPLRSKPGKVVESSSESAQVKAVLTASTSKGRGSSLPSATVLLAANAVVFRELTFQENRRRSTASSKRAKR